MPLVRANDVELCYQVEGHGQPLLLIMGLGGQLTDWHPALVTKLAASFQVIRFDNRDIGLSQKLPDPRPSRWDLIKGNLWPAAARPPYTLADMADDAAGLLDALDLPAAHVVGMSMGGMIAQELTIRHPARVTSLCSIMSNTGDRRHGRPTPRVVASLARRGEPDRRSAIEVTLAMFRLVGGTDWNEAEQRERTSASLDRSYHPAGMLRQSQAIAAAPDRTEALTRIHQPTLVIHGLDDTLVRPSGGIATAHAVPGSRLLMFPDMGHDLPATRHDEMVEAIARNTRRATRITHAAAASPL